MEKERKHYLDNIRWITVVIVMIYHTIYMFNCSGVVKNIGVDGIPQLDAFLVYVYPWFMCLLFLISGISSKYSLEKRTNKEYIIDRTKKLLIPSIAGIFIYGWIAGKITSQYVDIFNGAPVPGFMKYIIYCLMGTGPLWFCHVLYLASVLLVIVRKIDKKNRLKELSEDNNIVTWIVVGMLIVLFSHLLNVPVVTVYRLGIYLFMFFLGYYIFAKQDNIKQMETLCIPLAISSIILGIAYVVYYYGTNYTDASCLESTYTSLYLYITILAILGLGKRYLNFSNKFTDYMTKNNFNFYILHYTIELLISYVLVTYFKLPFALNYVIVIAGTIILLPILTEIVKRIQIINKLVLGIYKKKDNQKTL